MTGLERAELATVIGLVRDLRDEVIDRFDQQDERLRKVETNLASREAVVDALSKRTAASTVTKRWVMNIVLATIGTLIAAMTLIVGIAVAIIH